MPRIIYFSYIHWSYFVLVFILALFPKDNLFISSNSFFTNRWEPFLSSTNVHLTVQNVSLTTMNVGKGKLSPMIIRLIFLFLPEEIMISVFLNGITARQMARVAESAVILLEAHFQCLIAISISVWVQMMEEECMFPVQIKWTLLHVDFSMDL